VKVPSGFAMETWPDEWRSGTCAKQASAHRNKRNVSRRRNGRHSTAQKGERRAFTWFAAETLRRRAFACTVRAMMVADSLRRGLSAARFLHTFWRDTGGYSNPGNGIAPMNFTRGFGTVWQLDSYLKL